MPLCPVTHDRTIGVSLVTASAAPWPELQRMALCVPHRQRHVLLATSGACLAAETRLRFGERTRRFTVVVVRAAGVKVSIRAVGADPPHSVPHQHRLVSCSSLDLIDDPLNRCHCFYAQTQVWSGSTRLSRRTEARNGRHVVDAHQEC